MGLGIEEVCLLLQESGRAVAPLPLLPALVLASLPIAEFGTVEKKVMTQGETAEWVQVLCDQNATPEKITEVRKALQAQGFELAPEGGIDAALTDALLAYQEREGIRRTGLMTESTLSALGVGLQ